MSESPQGEEIRRLVDDLEEKHVDVAAALGEEPDDTQENLVQEDGDTPSEDESPAVPGSPEPTD